MNEAVARAADMQQVHRLVAATLRTHPAVVNLLWAKRADRRRGFAAARRSLDYFFR